MRTVKKYLKMLISAVLSLAICLISGKKASTEVKEMLAYGHGQADLTTTMKNVSDRQKIRNNNYESKQKERESFKRNRGNLLQKSALYRRNGPGDPEKVPTPPTVIKQLLAEQDSADSCMGCVLWRTVPYG